MSSDPNIQRQIGPSLAGVALPNAPLPTSLTGQHVSLQHLSAEHAASLYKHFKKDPEGLMWTYLPVGPFSHYVDFLTWVQSASASVDPYFYAIIDPQDQSATGVASYLRISPENASIEIGCLMFSPTLQRTAGATETLYLMLDQVFSQHYRRCEWKCDVLNLASRNAALRLGFLFEGIFRQASIYKGRNRDTAWYAIIDKDWPALDAVFLRWLSPSNFDDSGRQRQSLSAMSQAEHAS